MGLKTPEWGDPIFYHFLEPGPLKSRKMAIFGLLQIPIVHLFRPGLIFLKSGLAQWGTIYVSGSLR